jgi:hypothetical protein
MSMSPHTHAREPFHIDESLVGETKELLSLDVATGVIGMQKERRKRKEKEEEKEKEGVCGVWLYGWVYVCISPAASLSGKGGRVKGRSRCSTR